MAAPSNPPGTGVTGVRFVSANLNYVPVVASQTGASLGPAGAIGDYLNGVLVIPATTAAGNIAILDGSTSIAIFVTGTLSSLVPFFIPIGAVSVSGAWTITTGANVSVLVTGRFT